MKFHYCPSLIKGKDVFIVVCAECGEFANELVRGQYLCDRHAGKINGEIAKQNAELLNAWSARTDTSGDNAMLNFMRQHSCRSVWPMKAPAGVVLKSGNGIDLAIITPYQPDYRVLSTYQLDNLRRTYGELIDLFFG